MIRGLRKIVAIYRDAFGGLPRVTWLLCLAAFLNRCGSMVLPFLSIYLGKEFGYTPGQAGEIVALYGMGAVLGSWLGGRLADLLGPIVVQVVTLAAAGIWMMAISQVSQAWLLGPCVFVLGVINDAFRPGSITAVAMSVEGPLRRKALSLNRLMMNAGWAVGPTVGGFLIAIDRHLMFFADGGTCLLSAAFLWVFLRGFAKEHASPTPPVAGAPVVAAIAVFPRGPFRDPHFVGLMAINFVVTTAFMQYFTTGSRVFEQDYGYSETTIGLLLAINPVLITLLEMPIVHSLRARAALPIIAFGSLLIGVGFLFYLLPFGLGAAVLALVAITIGEVFQMPLLGAYINDRAPAKLRGAYNGAYGMSFSMALVAAPALGGWTYDAAGAPTLWVGCGVAGALAALGFWWAHRRQVAAG